MYKEFNHETFAKYDLAARDSAKRFWQSQGYECFDNEDEFGVDLVVQKDGKRFYCEVEVKTVWHGKEFMHDTMHIPVRKAKFLNMPTQFMVFNNSRTRAGIIGRKHVLAAPTKHVKNVKLSFGERFFDVPVENVIFVPIPQENL